MGCSKVFTKKKSRQRVGWVAIVASLSLPLSPQKLLVERISSFPRPVVISTHFHFINFSDPGLWPSPAVQASHGKGGGGENRIIAKHLGSNMRVKNRKRKGRQALNIMRGPNSRELRLFILWQFLISLAQASRGLPIYINNVRDPIGEQGQSCQTAGRPSYHYKKKIAKLDFIFGVRNRQKPRTLFSPIYSVGQLATLLCKAARVCT